MINPKSILATFIGLSILILSVSVSYYFVVFIPNAEKEKLNEQSAIEQEKILLEQQFKEEKKLDYEKCLANAELDFREHWQNRCEANNIPLKIKQDGTIFCTLTDELSATVREDYEKNKENCLEVFKQY